jgi:hypothetical protein
MSEERKQADGELFDTETPESSSDAASTTEGAEEASGGEESNEALDLDEGTASKEEQKQKQVDAWAKKIDAGKASLDDLSKHQQWLKPLLEEKLQVTAKANAKAEELDVEAIVERKIAEKESNSTFISLKADLNSMKLSGKQKAEVKREFNDFLTLGVSKEIALEKAVKIAGIKLEVKSSRRDKMVLPTPDTYNGAGDISSDANYGDLANVPEAKRLEHLKKLSSFS